MDGCGLKSTGEGQGSVVRFCEHVGEAVGCVHCENLEVGHLSAAQKELCYVELLKL
jgi:hypothetical protein